MQRILPETSGKITDNCLSLFKLIAALQVLYGHAIVHMDINSNAWLDRIFGIFQGVPIFFTISGFLIWFSIERTVFHSCYFFLYFYAVEFHS